MQQNTVEISKGLRFIFAGLALNFLTFLPVEELVFAGSILSFGITLSGLIFAARGDRKYLTPLVLLTVNTLGVQMLAARMTGEALFWTAVVRLTLTVVTLCLICITTLPWVAQRLGRPSRLGRAAWIGCVLSGTTVLAFNLLAVVPGQELLAAVISLLGLAALVATAVIYLLFIWKAGTLLKNGEKR